MREVIYFCPNDNTPIGGVKVIHRHSELINELGGRSSVFYHIGANAGKIDWFPHNAVVKTDAVFSPGRDFVILPEALILDFWKELRANNVDYGVFIQNGYLVRIGIEGKDLEECYEGAKLLLCISEDVIHCLYQFFPRQVHKIVRLNYSVNTDVFKFGPKTKTITYMPRKMPRHVELLIPSLASRLPEDWRLVAIDNMNEAQVAETLSRSQVFLAFSDFEGLPVPPVEAALSGNFVVGYTGQGGKEYWHRPIFTAVESGDVAGFLDAALQKVHGLENGDLNLCESHLAFLKALFSRDMEIHFMKEMLERISS